MENSGKLRKLPVDMNAVLEALELQAQDLTYYLDTVSGEVAPWIDPQVSGEEDTFDPDDERYVALPQRESRDDYRAMEEFVLGLDEEDVRAVLRQAITGKGAFGRFRQALAGYPDLRVRWEEQERERLIVEAVAWLAEIGIEPERELAPRRPPEPEQRPAPSPGQAPAIGLLDMLLLGAPEGKTELLEGRVHRVFVAPDQARARAVFARLARELTEYHGLSWRRRLIADTDRYAIERFEVTVDDRIVDLSVAVPRALWDAFCGS